MLSKLCQKYLIVRPLHVYMNKTLRIFSPFDVTWAKRGRAGLNPFCFTIQTIAGASESLRIRIRNIFEVALVQIVTVVSRLEDMYLSHNRQQYLLTLNPMSMSA